jgi:hypothetical protein
MSQDQVMKKLTELKIGVFTMMVACCGMFDGKKKDKDEEPKPEAPRLVGRIASIPPDKRFVLIQSYGSWDIEQGALLTTRGPEERSANLLVTGESLGQFAAADLQSGGVEIGDAVYSRHVPKPVEAHADADKPQEMPENQQIGLDQNVQKNN